MVNYYAFLRRGFVGVGCWLLLLLGFAQSAVAQTYTMPTSGTANYTTCSGTLYDNGGAAGFYSANANGIITLTPATAGNKIRLQFDQYTVDYSDMLTIYDGSSTSAPVIGTYETQSPGTVYATNSAGTLTIRFTTDANWQYAGFAASISCVTSVPQADLAVQNASVQPLTAVPGSTLGVNCTVYNLANTPAQASSVGYYLSTDATLDANDVLLGNSSGGTLAGNASSYRTASLLLPAGTPTGSYYVLFVADHLRVVSESNEANNTASVAVSVVPSSVDLITQQVAISPATTTPGSPVMLSCYIYNQGNTTSNFSSVGYYLSTNTTLDANDQLLAASFGNQLTPGYSQYRSTSANVPAGTVPGTYYVLFVADYQNVTTETNETNNVTTATLTVVTPSADLVVSSANMSQTSVSQGSSVSISTSAYVYNQGNTQAAASSLGVYFSTDAVLSAGDVLMSTSSVGSLSSGGGQTVYNQFTVSNTLAPGTYYVLFAADYQNTVTEINETNNVRAVTLTVVTPSIDLAMQEAYVSPTSVSAGTTVAVSGTILNQGNTTAASSNVGYYFSTNASLDANDVLIGTTSGGSLGAGGYSTRYANLTIPVSATPGTYYVLFVADYQNAVTETNETNNVRAVGLTVVAPSRDLLVSSAYMTPNVVSAGTSVSVSTDAYVYNQGNTQAAASSLGIYLSTNTTLSADDVLLTSGQTGSLNGGAGQYQYNQFTIPGTMTAGTYYVLFVADYQNTVTEINETNNVRAVSLTVVAPSVDLIVQEAYANPTNVSAGATLETSSYIYNQGNTTASSSNVGYYFSTNASLDANDVLIGTTSGGSLGAGGYSTRYANLTIPVSATPGTYYVLFVADYQNVVTETNETNNVRAVSLIVTPPFNGTVVPFSGSNTITTCATTVYDHGGTNNYQNGANGTLTINPGVTGRKIRLNFSFLSVENCCDRLTIYDGPSTSAPVIGSYAYTPGIVTASSSNSTGALTLQFSTDGSVVSSGFEAAVTCVSTGTPSNQPDLILSQPVLSASSVQPGGALNVSAVLTNQGGVMAAPSVTGYYLSTDDVWGNDDILLALSTSTSLTAGATTTVATGVVVPATTAVGRYYLLFVADHYGAVAEGNEANNVIGQAFNVSVVSSNQEQADGLTFRVYPNPAKAGEALRVELAGNSQGKRAELGLYNALGQQLLRQPVQLSATPTPVTLDTQQLSRGVYTLRLTGDGINATRRVVIE